MESDFDTQNTIQDSNLGLDHAVGDSLIVSSPRKVCSTHVRMFGFGRAVSGSDQKIRLFAEMFKPSKHFSGDKQSGLVG